MKATVDAKQIYQDSAVRGATPIDLVVILYDSAIEDMRKAISALKEQDIEARTADVGHALLVLAQLQGTLDFERGGSAAKQFEQFYDMVRAKLLEAQMRGSLELIQQQIRVMSEVRACWVQAKRIMQPPTGHDTVAAAAHRNGGSEGEWNA